jgi:dihydrofolate reductase
MKEAGMGRIVVTEFISLDGVIEAPGGGEPYAHGGWTFAIDRGEDGTRFKADELAEAHAQLLGRVTYEGFAAAWPSRSGDPYSDKFNAMPKYVVSRSLKQAEWNNSSVIADDIFERIRELKQEQNLLVWGSPTLVQSLIDNDLVDEYVLLVSPIVRSEGKRLFRDRGPQHDLQISEARVLGGGMLALRMTPAG